MCEICEVVKPYAALLDKLEALIEGALSNPPASAFEWFMFAAEEVILLQDLSVAHALVCEVYEITKLAELLELLDSGEAHALNLRQKHTKLMELSVSPREGINAPGSSLSC